MSRKPSPFFSVVIATRNRQASLMNALQVLKKQSLPRNLFEILVVDNGSTDRTCALVHDRMRSMPNLKYLFLSEQNVSLARNLGAQEAQGKWLAFTDDDCLPPADWLACAHLILQRRPGLIVLGGPVFDRVPRGFSIGRGFTPAGWPESFGRKGRFLLPNEAHIECNLLIQKQAFGKVGGFRATIGPGNRRFGFHEGTELQARLDRLAGKKPLRWYSPRLKMQHVVRRARTDATALFWRALISGYDHTRAFPKPFRHSVPLLSLRAQFNALLAVGVAGLSLFLPPLRNRAERLVFRVGEMWGELTRGIPALQTHRSTESAPRGPARRLLNLWIPGIKAILRLFNFKNLPRMATLTSKAGKESLAGLAWLETIPRIPPRYEGECEQLHPPHPRLARERTYVSPPAFRFCLKDARAFGPTPAVCDRRYTLVKEVSTDWGKEGIDLGAMRILRLSGEKTLSGETFLGASLGGETYFHWMTEVLPMFLLEKKQEKGLMRFRQILMHPYPKAFHQETFRSLGIRDGTVLPLDKHVVYRCEKLIAHSPHHMTGRAPGPTLKSVAGFFLPPASRIPAGPERLMILRGAAHSRPLLDREAIAGELTAKGFTEYEPAQDSIADQARAFRRARVIVATHGAALTNLIFCRPGTVLIELFSAKYVNPCYLHICQQLGIRHLSLMDDTVPNGVVHDLWATSEPILVTPSQVKLALRKAGL